MNSKTNLVCAGIDDGYLWPFLVSIFAAKIHASGDFRVAVGSINGGLSEESKKIIESFSHLLNISMEIKDFSLNQNLQTTDLNIQIYARLLWLDTLEENFLWLDADTLPLEKWDEIFLLEEGQAEEVTISAVIDKVIIENMPKKTLNKAYIAGGRSYFNAGIFIGNPMRWKKLDFPRVWQEISRSVEDYGFFHSEQDLLNYLLAKEKRILPSEFNAMVMPGSDIKQKILHFTGNPKPWHFTENAKRYFISIELLKHPKKGLGAFGGMNWVYEYNNYWRHEKALLDAVAANTSLFGDMCKLFFDSRRELFDSKDRFKFSLLSAVGRKWS